MIRLIAILQQAPSDLSIDFTHEKFKQATLVVNRIQIVPNLSLWQEGFDNA